MQIDGLKYSTSAITDTVITITSDPKVEVQRSEDDGVLYHIETRGNGGMYRTEVINGEFATVISFPNS